MRKQYSFNSGNMKKTILLSALIFVYVLSYSQIASKSKSITLKAETSEIKNDIIAKNYNEVDQYVMSLKKHYTDIDDLSYDLTNRFKNPEDKVRAIYRWMTNNISYDCKDYHRGATLAEQLSFKYKNREEFRNIYALKVLRSKKAICSGYAILFYELCYASGIRCEIVEGAADSNVKKISFYRRTYYYYPDHAWNKVLISDIWYYVDVTWSSGSCDSRIKNFTKNFNPYYYLTSINNLYLTHVENKY
jgi:transglutaminase/protease-like cytokinesis protein 3